MDFGLEFVNILCLTGAVIISFVLLRKYIEGGQFYKSTRCDGKVVLITGANTGIGKITAIEMAKRGAKVYIACRSMEKANAARDEIIQLSNSSSIHVRELDLASMESIRKFAEKFKAEEPKLDILINNAGVMACPKMLTKDGFEMQIGVNHLGHFLLTHLLLDNIKAAAPSRIVVLSSMAHSYGTINKNDLMSEKAYNQINAYSQSKLANVLFTRELAKRLKGTNVTVNAVHPGTVNTDLPRHMGTFFILFSHQLVKPLLYLFFKTPQSGAQTSLYAALDPELDNVSGVYLADCQETATSDEAKDDEKALWLWNISAKLTGVSEKTD